MLNKRNELGNNSYFDPKMGALGAAVMGPVVYYLNQKAGVDIVPIIYHLTENISLSGPVVAGLKQAGYTFFMAGALARMNQNLSTARNYSREARIAMGTLVPSIITSALNYGLHNLEGTPEPEISTLPTLLTSFPGFLWLSFRNNKKLERRLVE